MQGLQENSANMYEKELNDYNNFLKMNNPNNKAASQEKQEKNSANMYEKELNDYDNYLKMNNLNNYAASADLELQKNTPLNNNNFNSLPQENDRYNNANIMQTSNNQPVENYNKAIVESNYNPNSTRAQDNNFIDYRNNYNKAIVESNYNPNSTRAQDNNFIDYRNEVNKNQRKVNSNNSVSRDFKNDNQTILGGLNTTDVTNNELVYKANSGVEYDQYQNVLYLFD